MSLIASFNSRIRLSAFVILIMHCVVSPATAQSHRPKQETLMIETYWRYAYTMHLESGTVVHQADDQYDLVVVFHYDSVFRMYNNGLQLEGKWSYQNGTLHFPFRQVNDYRLTSANYQSLDLAFNPPNNTGTFIYHFVADNKPAGMFARREGELPEVLINENAPAQKRFFVLNQKKKKNKAKEDEAEAFRTPITIEMTGGGYYGGIDPVIRDNIMIKSNGRLIKEVETLNRGLQVTKTNVPREELEAFAAWAEQQSFFELERQYDCTSNFCDKRKIKTPRPIPLRIVITYGNRRKMVTVSIWGKDKNGEKYVDYPPQIDHIVDAVHRMANRI